MIAEDLALLREGLVALLRENDIEVVAQVEDGPGLLQAIAGHNRTLRSSTCACRRRTATRACAPRSRPADASPSLGVLVLSQYVETAYAGELIGEDTAGIGYLLKERVGDVHAFLDALPRLPREGP